VTSTRMATEIDEQPAALARTIDALRPLRAPLRQLADGQRLILFVARGSSDNAATYARYLCEIHALRVAALAAPSVATHYRANVNLGQVLAVCISQSGATQEILESMEWARAHGARTVAITNVEHSPLAAAADLALVTQAGPEVAVPATKTYTTQLAALAIFATALAPEDPAFEAALDRVPGEAERLLAVRPGAEEFAQRFQDVQRLVVSGRGLVYGTALELALKVKETCYLPALGLSYADLRHGPIAVLDPATPALLVAAASGPMLPGMVALAQAVEERGSCAFGIGGDSQFAASCREVLPGPDLPETLAPLALIVPGQLFVEALARARGLDPDDPRGLTKVTQTEVDGSGPAIAGQE
jgi:glutamine---fructose-6-phosphate transaminase (isomerizing)